jgi:hypothetical protein
VSAPVTPAYSAGMVDDGPYEYRLRQRPTEWILFRALTFGPLGMAGERDGQPWPCTLLYADILESRMPVQS